MTAGGAVLQWVRVARPRRASYGRDHGAIRLYMDDACPAEGRVLATSPRVSCHSIYRIIRIWPWRRQGGFGGEGFDLLWLYPFCTVRNTSVKPMRTACWSRWSHNSCGLVTGEEGKSASRCYSVKLVCTHTIWYSSVRSRQQSYCWSRTKSFKTRS